MSARAKVLYVTTFAADMAECSGRPLLDSFLSTHSDGRLLACVEGLPNFTSPDPERVLVGHLEETEYFTRWLADNAAYIPAHLGGLHPGVCACRGGPLSPHDKRHRMPCIGHWFCRNAARWFRKVAALRMAAARPELHPTGPVRHLIWVDADAVFRKRLSAQVVGREFFPSRAAFFYHRSRRPVLEAGVVGYDLSRGARGLIDAFVAAYAGDFWRSGPRWDDSYVLQRVLLKLHGRVPAVDLASRVSRKHAEVIPFSPVGAYLCHFKGRHGRGMGIMT